MQILDGKAVAEQIRGEIATAIGELKSRGITPGLGTVLVGDDAASTIYINAKHRACEEIGMASIHRHLPETTTQDELEAVIAEFNANPAVHAYLVQLPLPKGLDEARALLAIDPEKDVDGLHPVSLGRLVMGAPGALPCTPAGIQELLVRYGVPIEGRHVVVVGRGITIGRPMALLLALKRPNCNAAVTVVHTGVPDIGYYTRQGDIVIAAAGSPGIVKAEMIKPGAAVVGAGVSREGNRIISDLDEGVAAVAGWMTPRVGGVGPMTIAMLLRNTVLAAQRHADRLAAF
jgi:methylenetetrahydrofolate dehydrogenase (NADP+)/methenyltetrahydrofolate cyclohydrolase